MAEYSVAKVDDVPPGRAKVFQAGEHQIVLCNVAGQFYAIQDRCTHDDGPLGDGELWDEIIECPRHGAQFNVKTGEVVALPAVLPIATYPVKVEGNDIKVRVNGSE